MKTKREFSRRGPWSRFPGTHLRRFRCEALHVCRGAAASPWGHQVLRSSEKVVEQYPSPWGWGNCEQKERPDLPKGQKDCRRRVSISLPLDLQSSALPYELRQPSLKAETDFCYPFSPNQPRWLSDSCELLVREQASLPRGKLLTGKGGSMDESGAPWIS